MAGLVLGFFHRDTFWVVAGFGLLYLLFLLVVSTNVRFNFFVRSLSRNPATLDRKIALTFDDGPVAQTLRILEILDQYQVKAGFFCIGRRIEEHPEIFTKIIAKGHIVGNHTYTHTKTMGSLNVQRLVWEIEECNRCAREIAGVEMKLFRPPFGIVNPKTRKALEKTGMISVGWSIRSYDALLSSEQWILKRVLKRVRPGEVLLFHDNKTHTAHILEQLLLFLREHNYEVERPDKLLKINAYT